MKVINVGGYDFYTPSKKHESGNYIVFKFLKEMGIDTEMHLTRAKASGDPLCILNRLVSESDIDKIGPHDCIIYNDESVSMENIKKIYEKYKSKIIFITQAHGTFTGGCSYAHGCEKYTDSCGSCPQLNSFDERDKTFVTLQKKKETLSNLPVSLIVGSENSFLQASRSAIFRHCTIKKIPLPNDIPFCKKEKELLRKEKGFRLDKKVMFWGTTQPNNPRKGFRIFEGALINLIEDGFSFDDVEIVVAGPGMENVFSNLRKNLKLNIKCVGYLSSREEMSEYYKMSDFSVCSTLDDAGPMMISESLINHCPVVTFDTSISLDLIENEKTGFISPVSVEMLSSNINKMLLKTSEEIDIMAENGSLKAREFHSKDRIRKLWFEHFRDIGVL